MKKALLKIKREMYKNRFDNDDAWREADKVYREAKLKGRTQEKLRILEEVEMKALDAEIDTTAREVKDEQLSCSWLYTYQNQTGARCSSLITDKRCLFSANTVSKGKQSGPVAADT